MRHVFVTLAVLTASSGAQAGVHPPEVEQRLSFLVNEWTIEGTEATYRENCEWYAERSFVVCNSVDRKGGAPEQGVSIFGWSAAIETYTYHHYDQSGRSRSESCFPNELGGLTCLGQMRAGANLIESRSYLWPVEGGAAVRSERSENGGEWIETARFAYIPFDRDQAALAPLASGQPTLEADSTVRTGPPPREGEPPRSAVPLQMVLPPGSEPLVRQESVEQPSLVSSDEEASHRVPEATRLVPETNVGSPPGLAPSLKPPVPLQIPQPLNPGPPPSSGSPPQFGGPPEGE